MITVENDGQRRSCLYGGEQSQPKGDQTRQFLSDMWATEQNRLKASDNVISRCNQYDSHETLLDSRMYILLNTDSHIDGRQEMSDHLTSIVEKSMGKYGNRITRVEAHITEANGSAKAGHDDIHCTLEARPVGREPVVVKDQAGSAHQAMNGALGKLERAIAREFKKLDSRHDRHPPAAEPETEPEE